MLLHVFAMSIVNECEPTAATISKLGSLCTTFFCWGVVTTVERNILRLQVASWGLR